MSLERIVILDTVQLDGKEIIFENSFFVDREEIDSLRAKLGLDGRPPIELSQKEKETIATGLRNMGFLSDEEVHSLGGIVIRREHSIHEHNDSEE